MSVDQAIRAIISKSWFANDNRDREGITECWRSLARTGKLDGEMAYHVACIAGDPVVWAILIRSKVFPPTKLIEYANLAWEVNEKDDIWRAVAEVADLTLLSVDEMCLVAERARSKDFSMAVLTSGRLVVRDVLVRGWNIFTPISRELDKFEELLTSNFEGSFWDKGECLVALGEATSFASFFWVIGHVPLDKGEVDRAVTLALGLNSSNAHDLVDTHIMPTLIEKGLHSIAECLDIIRRIKDARMSRTALLKSRGSELSEGQILELVLMDPTMSSVIEAAKTLVK